VAADMSDAQRAWKREDYKRAGELYARIVEKAPRLTVAKCHLGLCLILTGQSSKGCKIVDELLEQEVPVNALVCAIRAVTVLEEVEGTEKLVQRYRTSALHLAQRVTEETPEDPFPLTVLARLCVKGNDGEGLRLMTKLLVERFPHAVETHYYDGIRAAWEGDWRTADRKLRKAEGLGWSQDDPTPLIVRARLAMERENGEELRKASKLLLERFPDAMETHYFNGLRAAWDGDWITAEDELLEAGRRGLPQEEVDTILAMGIHTRALAWRYTYYTLYLIAGWLVGLAVLFTVGKALSAATVRSVERVEPTQAITPVQRVLRKVYRLVIALAAVYYYLSLPIIVILSVALPASLIYGMFVTGTAFIQLLLVVGILGLAMVFTAFTAVWTSFVRVRDDDPGRALRPNEAPPLWELTREVAREVGTRPIDEIWLTPGSEISVSERGPYRQRLKGHGRRALVLGTAALGGLRQDAFRAIVAHEYGHFFHRDTAGGHLALRVSTAMADFAEEVTQNETTDWWNIAFQFLRVYHFLFRRISFGASRLQEVLADGVAVRTYGSDVFEQGLTHVVRRSVQSDQLAARAVNEGARKKRQLKGFCEQLEHPAVDDLLEAEEEVIELLKRSSSEDDTHPTPVERFALARRIPVQNPTADDALVWDLFEDRERLMREMNNWVAEAVQAQVTGWVSVQKQIIEHYTAALAENRTSIFYEERGIAYANLGRDEDALADLDKAIQSDPEAARSLFWRAEVHQRRSNDVQAGADLEKSLACSREWTSDESYYNRDECRYRLGECYCRLGQYESAARAFSSLIEADRPSLRALFWRGRASRAMDDRRQAIRDFTEVIEHCPRSAGIHGERGSAYLAEAHAGGDNACLQEAIADFTEAIHLDRRDATAYASRAKAYRALGEDDKAARDERKAEHFLHVSAGSPKDASTPAQP